jgi:hypothetical protein
LFGESQFTSNLGETLSLTVKFKNQEAIKTRMSFSKTSDEIQKVISSKKTEDEEVEDAIVDKVATQWMKEQLDTEIVRYDKNETTDH